MRRFLTAASIVCSVAFPLSSYAKLEICSEPSDLKVLAFGDGGTSDNAQYGVARTMRKFCDDNGCDIGLMLGDNFYPAGVKNVNDRLFKTAFETPYSPLRIPFYPALGNHDYGSGTVTGNVQAQIDYSEKSEFWKMPSRYHQFSFGDVDFFVLDTNTFKKETAQKTWFRDAFRESKAAWKIVYGHHPIYSDGAHGDTDFLVSGLLPELCNSAKNTLYLAGHDHDQQVLKAKCGLHMVVSGAAAYNRPVQKSDRSLFAKSETGFAYLALNQENVKLCVVSSSGQLLYSRKFSR